LIDLGTARSSRHEQLRRRGDAARAAVADDAKLLLARRAD
jgi:hypothetical protein